MLQKDIERFEIFGVDGKWLIKDNEQSPNLLDCYQSCVRLNQQDERIKELEEENERLQEEYNEVYADARESAYEEFKLQNGCEHCHRDYLQALKEQKKQMVEKLHNKGYLNVEEWAYEDFLDTILNEEGE